MQAYALRLTLSGKFVLTKFAKSLRGVVLNREGGYWSIYILPLYPLRQIRPYQIREKRARSRSKSGLDHYAADYAVQV